MTVLSMPSYVRLMPSRLHFVVLFAGFHTLLARKCQNEIPESVIKESNVEIPHRTRSGKFFCPKEAVQFGMYCDGCICPGVDLPCIKPRPVTVVCVDDFP